MTEKKNRYRHRYWEGIPDELRLMCLAQMYSRSHNYLTGSVLHFLIDRMYDCDSWIHETTPYDVIHWIDAGIETCLYPLEFHDDEWNRYSAEISLVLERSEQLFQKYAPADYREGYRTSFECGTKTNMIKLAQNLEIYFCTLYMYTGNWTKLQTRLTYLISAARRNMEEIIFDEQSAQNVVQDEWTEFEYPHFPWENKRDLLSWLGNEFIPRGTARRIFTNVYEKYVRFLYARLIVDRSELVSFLHKKAEMLLRSLCDEILDEIEDQLQDTEHSEILFAEREQFERMLLESEEREGMLSINGFS